MTRPSRSWAWRLLTWPIMILMIIGTVVVGRLILITTPIGDDANRAFIHTGQMHEPVDGHDFVVTVESIRGGRALQQIFDNATTDGLFLLVKIKVSAYDKTTALMYEAVVDAKGNRYETPTVDFNHLNGRTLQPRIPVEGELIFEVPAPAAGDHLKLRLSSRSFDIPDHQVTAEIPLDVTEAQVSSWFRNAQPLRPMDPEVTT